MTQAPGDPLPLDAQLCFSLYSTTIAINRLYKPMLDSLGVTYPQYLVLSTLWEEEGQTISAFVSRQRNPVDERQGQVFLTAKGKGLRQQTTCLTDALLAGSKLSVPEMIALNEQIRTLRAALVDG